MDNTLVSARIPRAKKERGGSVLASMGATISDLINSAFDYVIETNELPNAKEATNISGDFSSFVEATTLNIDWPAGFDGDYKALMANMRIEDYESLA